MFSLKFVRYQEGKGAEQSIARICIILILKHAFLTSDVTIHQHHILSFSISTSQYSQIHQEAEILVRAGRGIHINWG